MQYIDLKHWFNVGLALLCVSLGYMLSEALAVVTLIMALAVFFVLLFSALHRRFSPPTSLVEALNFEILDSRQRFSLHEISYYWEDRSLGPLPLDARAKQVFSSFVRALGERRVDFRKTLDEIFEASQQDHDVEREIRGDEEPFNVHTTVGRSELRRFAIDEGKRPMFLFYDRRAGAC
jgi:hypothetical protein